MTNPRLLTAFGIGDIVFGIAIWAITGNATVGVALLVAGVAVLAASAFAHRRTPDPDRAQRAEQAEAQVEKNKTDAEAENAEERPPPTGA